MPLYFFMDTRTGQKRNTGVHASSAAEAKKKLRRPPPEHAKLYKTLNKEPSGKQWDRTRADGSRPSGPVQDRGFGPSKAATAKAKRKR